MTDPAGQPTRTTPPSRRSRRHRPHVRAAVRMVLVALAPLTVAAGLPSVTNALAGVSARQAAVGAEQMWLDVAPAQTDRPLGEQPAAQRAAVPGAVRAPGSRPALAAGDSSLQAPGESAFASLGYDLTALGWTIGFADGRPGLLGVAYSQRRHIEVFVRPGQSRSLLRAVIAHEIGHAVDLEYNDDGRRARWRQLRAVPADQTWFGCSLCDDYATPAGDFAEVFSLWLAGPAHFRSALGGVPTQGQLAQLSALFAPPASGPVPATASAAPRPAAGRPTGPAPGASPRSAPSPAPSGEPTAPSRPTPACLPLLPCG